MDFIDTFSVNYHKLTTKDIVNLLYKEILTEERSEESMDELIEYSFHFPVDSDSYLEELNDKFNEVDTEKLRTIDGHLKAYIITFLYYCSNRIISLADIGKFFYERNMLRAQMYIVVNVIRDSSVPDENKVSLVRLFKMYCLKGEIDLLMVRGVSNSFTGTLMVSTTEVVEHIKDVKPLTLYCINSFKEIILQEDDSHRLYVIFDGLFRCVEIDCIESLDNKVAARSIIKVFIRDVLQEEFDSDKIQYLLNAFCSCWGRENFTYYEDAVSIMNVLKLPYYTELVKKMVQYTQSKNHRRFFINIMHLLVTMATNLPVLTLDKIQVYYSCAVRNIVYHFVDRDEAIVNNAVQTLTTLCMLRNNPMMTLVFNDVTCKGKFVSISIEALLLCLTKIADEKWGITPRNQNLLVIMARFLSSSGRVNSELVHKTLNTLCRDFTPFSLKPSLPILNELYLKLALKGQRDSASSVLKIIFKASMHQDATSTEFAEHIFNSMLMPTVIDGISYHPKYYYNIFLGTEFEYEALFSKCQRLIKPIHIDNVILNFNYEEPGAAVLLGCLLDYCRYGDSTVLVRYFINHFEEIAIRPIMGPLSIAFRKIVTNSRILQRDVTRLDVPSLDVLHCHLLEGLFEQTYQVGCIKPVFDLLQKLRQLLRVDMHNQVLSQLMTVTSERAYRKLQSTAIGDHDALLYLNELCLLSRTLPRRNVVGQLEDYMDDPVKLRVIRDCTPAGYVQLLALFTTLAMLDRTKVPLALRYTSEVLNGDSQIMKVIGFKLNYSLCREMTHEFEDIIKIAFKEVIVADPCLVKLCLLSIETLVHEDFIKLEAETFFRFVHVVACDVLGIFTKQLLMKRFMLSNQNDIAKYYVHTIMFLHVYSKMSNYPISDVFEESLVGMQLRLNCKKELPVFLFHNLSIKNKFNVLNEISAIFGDIVLGHYKVEKKFFPMLRDLLLTFRFTINPSVESITEKHFYSSITAEIENRITRLDPSYNSQSYYNEFEKEIRKCTLSLLKLLFYENAQFAEMIQITLFDALMHWIKFVKDEIIYYVHVERGREYGQYFSKLLQYYRRNRLRFAVQDRAPLPGQC